MVRNSWRVKRKEEGKEEEGKKGKKKRGRRIKITQSVSRIHTNTE